MVNIIDVLRFGCEKLSQIIDIIISDGNFYQKKNFGARIC